MSNYSINQVANETRISTHTLRYYEKLSLISPHRGANNYRYYTDNDILDIKYIQVLKYGGLSLKEIKIIFDNKNSEKDFDVSVCSSSIEILENKKKDILNQIENLHDVIKVLDVGKNLLIEKEKKNKIKINQLVLSTYNRIKK